MQGKVEKKYANPDNGGYTFVADDGEKVPLTPALMLQWAWAMVYILLFIVPLDDKNNWHFPISMMVKQQFSTHQILLLLTIKPVLALSSKNLMHHPLNTLLVMVPQFFKPSPQFFTMYVYLLEVIEPTFLRLLLQLLKPSLPQPKTPQPNSIAISNILKPSLGLMTLWLTNMHSHKRGMVLISFPTLTMTC